MILWNKEKIKTALKDDLIFIDEKYNFQIDNVVFDNRRINGNSLFIARKGEKNDGHNYIEQTLNSNQNVIILANESYINDNQQLKNNSRIIVVKDTIIAMEKMAIYARNNIKGVVIGITGSLGKTTTKELFYSCLSIFKKTFCNIQSFNNYIGVLTTLCNLPQNTDFAIIEMGMNQKGELEELSRIVQPDITVITNVVSAHSVYFNEEKEIAYAKAEIFKYQKKNGFCILNKSNKYFSLLENEAKKNNINTILTFGENINTDVSLIEYKQEDDFFISKYKINNQFIEYKFFSPDYNIVLNIMPLLVLMNKSNLDFNKIKDVLENFNVPRGRNNIEYSNYEGKNITIINGSYNAVNPLTFIRGLDLIDKIANRQKINRRIAIFGDIREAGENSENFMLSLKEHIIKAKIDILICIGDVIECLYNSIKNEVKSMYFKEYTQSIPIIKDLIQDNDLLFIKSSKGIKTYKILNELVENKMDIYE